MAWYNYVSEKGEALIKYVFYQMGLAIYHRPLYFLAAGFVTTCLCAIGFIRFYFETNGLYMFVPRDSTEWINFQQTIDYFGEFEQYAFVIIEQVNGESLLTPDGLDTVYTIFNYTSDFVNTYSGDDYSFSDVCLRYYDGYPKCVSEVEGLLALWGWNPNAWSNQAYIQAQVDAYSDAIDYFVGKLQYTNENDTSQVTGGSVIRLQLEIKGSTDSDLQTIYEEWQYGWEDFMGDNIETFLKTSNNDYDISGIKLHFFTTVSLYGEFARLVFVDAPVLFAAFVVMLVYLSLTFGKLNCVETRALLAMSLLLATMSALIVGMGLGCAFGWDMNTIVLLIPFILLGVGVDDGIIIVETLEHTKLPGNDVKRRDEQLAIVMKNSGMSISLTSFSSVIAFTIGAITSTLPGIISFCGYAALCFAANYIMQFIIFVPLLTYDEKRIDNKKNFCCPCIVHDDFVKEEKVNSNETENENEAGSKDDKDSKAKVSMSCVLNKTLVPLLSDWRSRCAIILIFLVPFGLTIYGLQYLDTETDLTLLVPDDSFIIEYYDIIDESFGDFEFLPMYIVVENRDFSDSETKGNVLSMISTLENNVTTSSGITIGDVSQWVDGDGSFDEFLQTYFNINDSTLLGSSTAYYTYLKAYTNATGLPWKTFIVYDDSSNPSKIKATRFELQTKLTNSLTKRYNWEVDTQDAFNSEMGDSDSGYIFTPGFLLAVLAASIVEFTLQNLAFAILGVFCVLVCLMDARMSLFITLSIAIIDVDLMGWMVVCGVSLDTVSYGELVMAVGLTCDYVIHMSHAIAHSHPKDPKDYQTRISRALNEMGVGVAKGSWTTFLGVMTLAFSSSNAFRIFFLMFCGIILISILHGFLFIPAVLGMCPWIYLGGEHESEDVLEPNGEAAASHSTVDPVARTKSEIVMQEIYDSTKDANLDENQTAQA